MEEIAKRAGLLFTGDFKCVVGIADEEEFSGVVPNGVTKIGEEAFSCCSAKNITLPDSVKEIGANAFCNCENLESLRLPKDLKTLSPYMFSGCSALKKIELPYEVDDFTEGLFSSCSSLEEVPFRDGIKTLGENVFSGCSSLTSLVIPSTVTKILNGAIVNCEKLSTVVLPENLEVFENGAIADCPNLSRIRISEDNKNFQTSEDDTKLVNKATGEVVFEVALKIQNDVPKVSDDDSAVSSVVAFDDVDDEADDKDVIFDKGQDESEVAVGDADDVVENGNVADSGVGDENDKNETKNIEENSMSDENVTQITAEGLNVIHTEVDDSETEASASPDVNSRLAEIMGQEKQYTTDAFNIMDIPAASEEEIQAECLTKSEEAENSEIASEGTEESETLNDGVNEIASEVTQEGETRNDGENENPMQEQVQEIIKDNTSDESVGITNIQVDSSDEPDENADVVHSGVADEGEERLLMDDLVFEAEKVKQHVIKNDVDEEKILYVFAENLSETQFGKDFSSRLIRCAERLAKIHEYTSIFYFHGIDLSNTNFKGKFTTYIKDKDCVFACASSNLSTLTGTERDFATCLNITLTKDEMVKQAVNARTPNGEVLKLLIQDIMD